MIETTPRARGRRILSWRLALLLLAFLPILFSAGGCPALANATDDGASTTLLWWCPLARV